MYSKSYNGSNKKIFWQEFWRHELEESLNHAPVVIIPVGSVEQHGPHCPMDVDISIPYHIATEVANRVTKYPVIVAPPVWTGFTHFNMGHIGTITVTLETYINLLCDICRSIKANGFERMILLNGHGGNLAPTQTISVKLAQEDIWALHITYFRMVQDELNAWGESDHSIGHGGEWETSLLLYLSSQMVALDKRSPNGLRPWFSSVELEEFAQWPVSSGLEGSHFQRREREPVVGETYLGVGRWKTTRARVLLCSMRREFFSAWDYLSAPSGGAGEVEGGECLVSSLTDSITR